MQATPLVASQPSSSLSVDGVRAFTADEVRAAVEHARRAQGPWAALSVRERARALARVRSELVTRADDLVDLETAIQGKTRVESYGAILACARLIGFLSGAAPRVLAPERPLPLFGLTRAHRVLREPYGVVGVIAPWNFPITLSLEPMLAALIAGNAVVMKPSEHVSEIGLALGRVFERAALGDLVRVVVGDGATGAALVAAGIDKLVVTGSVATGRKAGVLAAEHLVPVTMELGGKDAAIVLEDADLERAAAGIAWGANLNAGQACLAIERVYVVDAIADRFERALADEVRALRVGPGGDATTDVGAVTTDAQLATIEAQIEDALRKGARLLCGGERVSSARGPGRFYAPTVLADVTEEMIVMREETFGPVVAIARVHDAHEAIERTNGSRFGLTCSIWTRDIERALSLAARIRAGDVAIDEHAAPAGLAEIPWGGVKDSGFGRTRGVEGLLEMVTTKHVSWPRLRVFGREPYWFPYSARKAGAMRAALRLLYGTWPERLDVLFRR